MLSTDFPLCGDTSDAFQPEQTHGRRCGGCKNVGHDRRNCPYKGGAQHSSSSSSALPTSSSTNSRPKAPKVKRARQTNKRSNRSAADDEYLSGDEEESVHGEIVQRDHLDEEDSTGDEQEEEPPEREALTLEWAPHAILPIPQHGLRAGNMPLPIDELYPTSSRGGAVDGDSLIRGKKLQEPAQYVEVFWDTDIFETFVRNTNSYARNTHIRSWRDVDVPELKTFLSIVLFLGVKKFPTRHMAWDTGIFG